MAVNYRIEAKRLSSNANYSDRMMEGRRLLRAFKKAVDDLKILQQAKDRMEFKRPCDVRRRKRVMKRWLATEGNKENS